MLGADARRYDYGRQSLLLVDKRSLHCCVAVGGVCVKRLCVWIHGTEQAGICHDPGSETTWLLLFARPLTTL